MKKAFTVMIVLLVAFSVFAAKGDMKAGVQLGFGGEGQRMGLTKAGEKMSYLFKYSGFHFAGTFEYGIVDEVYAKAALGIATMGTVNAVIKSGGEKVHSAAPESTPINFNLYLGGEYRYAINEEFSVSGGLGFDMALGKEITFGALEKDDDEEWNVFNIRMGIAAEAAVGYSINDEIAVTLGGKFAWHFLNTDEKTKKNISLFKDVFDGKYFQYGFDVFAGVTYSF